MSFFSQSLSSCADVFSGDMRPRNNWFQHRNDLHGCSQTSYIIWRSCKGYDAMLDFLAGLRKWTVCRLSQCSSVRPRSRGCDTVLQRSETTPLREEQEMGQLHQCGRLVMFASEIFLFPLNIFKCLTFASCYQLNYCLSDSLSSCSQLKVFSFSVISFLPLSLLSSWR